MYVLREGSKILKLFVFIALSLCFWACSESAEESLASEKESRIENGGQPPDGLSYLQTSASYTINSAIAANTPSLGSGEATSFSITPELPAGLSFDAATGVISGTPTSLSASASYTITAENADGTTSTQLSLAVVDVAPSNLSYTLEAANYTRYAAITDNTPSADGGAITSYSVSPALPEGLSLDPSTGVISGTPTAYLPSITSFIVTASNSGGSTTATIDITVDVPDGTWLGGTGTNWSTAANWKGGTVPSTGDDAYFDDVCSTNCDVSIDSNISIQNLFMYPSFSGSITQAAGRTITVGTGEYDTVGGWFQNGGTFIGGDSNIRLDRIELNGGSFTSTSAELRLGINSDWHTFHYGFILGSNATFNHNSGTFYLDSQGSSTGADRTFVFNLDKTLVFYNFEADIMSEVPESDGTYNNKHADIIGSVPTIQVQNSFTLHDGQIRLGNIDFSGANAHFACTAAPARCSNSIGSIKHRHYTDGPESITHFRFVGSSAQSYSFDDGAKSPFLFYIDNSNGVSTTSPGTFGLASINIQSGSFTAPSGTLNLGQNANLFHLSLPNFILTSTGDFLANNGTVIINPYSSSSTTTKAIGIDVDPEKSLSFHNLTLDIDSGTSSSIDDNYVFLAEDTNLIIENDLRIKQGRFSKNFGDSGLLTVRGDYYLDCDDKANGQCASANSRVPLLFDTDGTSINIAAGVPTVFDRSDVEINVPGGTVTINSSMSTVGTSGNLDVTAGTLHIANASSVIWSDDLTNDGIITCDAGSYLQVGDFIRGTPQSGDDSSCYGP